MGFLRSKKGSIISDYFCAADDIGPFSRGDVVEIALYANHLELTEKSVGKKAAAVALPYLPDHGCGVPLGSADCRKRQVAGQAGGRWRDTVWQHRCGGRGHQRPGKEGSEAQTHAAHPQRHFD